jgi:hypothetical protein
VPRALSSTCATQLHYSQLWLLSCSPLNCSWWLRNSSRVIFQIVDYKSLQVLSGREGFNGITCYTQSLGFTALCTALLVLSQEGNCGRFKLWLVLTAGHRAFVFVTGRLTAVCHWPTHSGQWSAPAPPPLHREWLFNPKEERNLQVPVPVSL